MLSRVLSNPQRGKVVDTLVFVLKERLKKQSDSAHKQNEIVSSKGDQGNNNRYHVMF